MLMYLLVKSGWKNKKIWDMLRDLKYLHIFHTFHTKIIIHNEIEHLKAILINFIKINWNIGQISKIDSLGTLGKSISDVSLVMLLCLSLKSGWKNKNFWDMLKRFERFLQFTNESLRNHIKWVIQLIWKLFYSILIKSELILDKISKIVFSGNLGKLVSEVLLVTLMYLLVKSGWKSKNFWDMLKRFEISSHISHISHKMFYQ